MDRNPAGAKAAIQAQIRNSKSRSGNAGTSRAAAKKPARAKTGMFQPLFPNLGRGKFMDLKL